MTEQEAIEELKKDHYHLRKEIQYKEERGIAGTDELKEFDMAISALEKQIPKKPNYYGDEEDGNIECPNCESDLWALKESGITYCPDCGQHIDWGN